MDIKLKSRFNKDNKILIGIILIAILLTMLSYPLAKNIGDNNINRNKANYFASYGFSNELFETLEIINKEYLKSQKFEERLMVPYDELGYKESYTEQEKNQYLKRVNNYISQKESRYNRLVSKSVSKNIKYLITDTMNYKWTSNLTFSELDSMGITDPRFFTIDYDNLYSTNLSNEMDYIGILEIDNKGKIKEIYTSGRNNDFETRYNFFYENYGIKPLTSIKALYMVPKELVEGDRITSNIRDYINRGYSEVSMEFTLVGMGMIFLIGIFMPNKYTSRLKITQYYSRLNIEIKGLVIAIGYILFGGYVKLATHNIKGDIVNPLESQMISLTILNKLLLGLFSIVLIGSIYLIAYLMGAYIKYVSKVGPKEGLFKTSWIINNIVKGIKVFISLFKSPQTLVKPYKQIKILIGINFIIISVIAMTWIFGIALAIIYSIVLLWVSKKYIKKVQEDFNKLHQFTSEMEKGHLDVELEDDLGIFTPIGESLIKIKDGFQQAVEKEVKSERMKTELISNVSHDLKTPLTSIITYIDLLKDISLGESTRQDYINVLDNKSKRLQILIEDLFEASKAASGNISLEIQEIDLVALMNQVLGELKDKMEKSKLIFKTHFPENKVMIQLDGRRTVRVVENLIGNSIKYALPHSRVFIEIEEEIEYAILTIKNISAQEMDFTAEEIVERFNRGDTSRHTEGSGLGLAISKSLVELQGGEFKVILDGDLFKVVIKFKK